MKAAIYASILNTLVIAVAATGQVIPPPPCAPQCTTFTHEPFPRGEYQGVSAIRVASGLNGGTWAIAEEAFDTNGNKKLLEWMGSGFVVREGGAVRVAIDDQRTPWVISAQGNIFRRNLASPTGWDLMPGMARYIAAGRAALDGSGAVWVVGTAETGDGNYELYKWNGRDGWTRAPGAGVKVAVDSTGTVWVQLADGRIVQRTTDGKDSWLDYARGVDLFVHSDGPVGFLGLPAEGTQYRVRKRTSKGWSVLGYAIEPDQNLRPVFRGPTFESVSFDRSGAVFTIASDHQLFGPYKDTSKAQKVGDWLDMQGESEVISRKAVKLPGYMQKVFLGPNGQAFALGRGKYQMVYRFVNGEWELMGNSARSMAVEPDGTPWVVNEDDTVYKFQNNQWTRVPLWAKEIAIGHDGSIFALSINPATDVGDTRNYRIFKWNGSTVQNFPGGAVKIAVQADGIPWVVSADSRIWRWNSGSWVNVPGAAHEIYGGKTIHILDASTEPEVRVLGSMGTKGESRILRLGRRLSSGGSEQVQFPDTNPDKTGYVFNATGSSAISLATTGDNVSWTVGADHSVIATFEATKGDESNYRALTERCKSTLLFQTLCAAAPYHIHPALPLLLRVEDYAREAATSTRPEAIRMAAYQGLLQIAWRGSDVWTPEEKAVLSWWVHRVKDDRVLASVETLREYYRWHADPQSYRVPEGFGFEPYHVDPVVGFGQLFGATAAPPLLNRKEGYEWIRDIFLATVVGSGYGNLLAYSATSPDTIGFPAYGQARAFEKVLGGANFVEFASGLEELTIAKQYLDSGLPVLQTFLLDSSKSFRNMVAKQTQPFLPRTLNNLHGKIRVAMQKYPVIIPTEVLEWRREHARLIKNFLSTSSGALEIVMIGLDILLERISQIVGEGKLGDQLETASADAQARAVPDIHHLLGFQSIRGNTTVIPGVHNKPVKDLTAEDLDYLTGEDELFLSFVKATKGCDAGTNCTPGIPAMTIQ
jgi:hypothetical protein